MKKKNVGGGSLSVCIQCKKKLTELFFKRSFKMSYLNLYVMFFVISFSVNTILLLRILQARKENGELKKTIEVINNNMSVFDNKEIYMLSEYGKDIKEVTNDIAKAMKWKHYSRRNKVTKMKINVTGSCEL